MSVRIENQSAVNLRGISVSYAVLKSDRNTETAESYDFFDDTIRIRDVTKRFYHFS